MELQKFYQINTNNIVYVVTGAIKKAQALKYVSQYKKEKYTSMLLTHNVIRAKIVNNDLYVGNNETLNKMDGIDCFAVYRKIIKLVA